MNWAGREAVFFGYLPVALDGDDEVSEPLLGDTAAGTTSP